MEKKDKINVIVYGLILIGIIIMLIFFSCEKYGPADKVERFEYNGKYYEVIINGKTGQRDTIEINKYINEKYPIENVY
jgi:hypothetical protein